MPLTYISTTKIWHYSAATPSLQVKLANLNVYSTFTKVYKEILSKIDIRRYQETQNFAVTNQKRPEKNLSNPHK